MEAPNKAGMAELRKLYMEENATDHFIDYADKFLFSMNQGDYEKLNYTMGDEFRRYVLPNDSNPFEELLASVRFEDVVKGRQGTVLVHPDPVRGAPIVRTTTRYGAPAQRFKPQHLHLAQLVQTTVSLPTAFNNALIEVYGNSYYKMGPHSDQAQDLAGGSSIAVFSCYKHPELAAPPRKLVVESKEIGGSKFEIPLTHNSVVVWSLDTNRRFKHKIVLDVAANPPDNQWLGITFRTSKTFIQNNDGRACFEDGAPLQLAAAGDERCEKFYKMRGAENRETGFSYPPLDFTISQSDLMPPG